jgi:hypothetical protein
MITYVNTVLVSNKNG